MTMLGIHIQQLRSTLFSCCSELTRAEREYLDMRWSLIDGFLTCSSASELALKLEISKCSEKLQTVDYIAIIFGYCCQRLNGQEYMFEFPVIIEMIDRCSWFDDIFRNAKFLRILMKYCSSNCRYFLGTRNAPRKILAHIAKKFPSVKRMNFMFTHCKTGKLKRKITDEEFEKWY